jgi:hypothetical protein
VDPKSVFVALDAELKALGVQRELIICGGAALIAMGIVARETRDVDVLLPVLDPELHSAAKKIGKALDLNEGWLNNGPRDLIQALTKGWESHCTDVFRSTNLVIRSIGRSDLICSKLYAAADRPEHLPDLVALKPSETELEAARTWVLARDASEIWPRIVQECAEEVRRRLGYEKS